MSFEILPTPSPTIPAAFNNATFTYDGDGKRIKSTFNGTTTTYFVGAHYEVTGSTIIKYYYTGAQRIAMRTNGTLNYLLGDHLGSTSLITDSAGNKTNEQRYKAWGETRYTFGSEKTKYQYTGQFSYTSDFGLMYYGARWYDTALGRFAQADSIIPGPGNSQAWDRYAYSFNNPIIYVDPDGHNPILGFIGGFLKELARTNLWFHPGAQRDLAIQNNESTAELAGRLVADVASLAIGAAEAGGGTGISGGGVVACATGVGCLGGAGAIAAGGVLIAQGAGTAINAGAGAGQVLNIIAGRGNSQPGFGSSSNLTDHFKRHGAELGYDTESQYLNGAQNFIGTRGSDDVLTLIRSNGDKVLFNPVTDEFAVVASNGTIRTYFKPDPSIHGYKNNLEYFYAQGK